MSGIGGYLLRSGPSTPAILQNLLGSLAARGPDNEGVCLIQRREGWTLCRTGRTTPSLAASLPHFQAVAQDAWHDLALLHTRFAVTDRSTGGHQPVVSGDGSVVAVFQGQIFNHAELRQELQAKGVRFRSVSDAEVLVEGYRAWHESVWQRLNGFWAVALYDQLDDCVVLCRDRLGIAPLYYRETVEGFYFASLIRPLVAVAPRASEIDATIVRGFIETELKDYDARTCYASIRSLPPGTAWQFARDTFTLQEARPAVFWSYPQRSWTEEEVPFGQAVDRFRELFMDAVALRMRADVPLAFELSGGLDSSSIVAAAAVQGAAITTYTVKVPESDEEPYARTLKRRYAIDYRVIERPEVDFFADAKRFVTLMEEPFHSPNVYTHYKLRQLMKNDGVGVVLAGSGGDAALAGDESEYWPQARAELMRQRRRLQALVCHAGFQLQSWDRSRDALREGLKLLKRTVLGQHRVRSTQLPGPNPAARLVASYPDLDFHNQRIYHYTVGLTPYYLLSDDHLTMSLPVEQRCPFFDYRIVDFGLRLPAAYLFRRGWTKYILRKAMEPWLPRRVVWRRQKMGFPFPLQAFLQRHRSQFGPLPARVAAAGLTSGAVDFDVLLHQNPQRLWRICSTGLWLELERQS